MLCSPSAERGAVPAEQAAAPGSELPSVWCRAAGGLWFSPKS